MSINIVKGDIRLTAAQTICLGMNARGQVEVTPLETSLRDTYPVFYSEFRRMGRGGLLREGQLWIFRDSTPWFAAMIIKDSGSSPPRLRHLEQALVNLRRDWQREQLRTLAIAPIGDELEWQSIRMLIRDYLNPLPIPVLLYEAHIPGQAADESGLNMP